MPKSKAKLVVKDLEYLKDLKQKYYFLERDSSILRDIIVQKGDSISAYRNIHALDNQIVANMMLKDTLRTQEVNLYKKQSTKYKLERDGFFVVLVATLLKFTIFK